MRLVTYYARCAHYTTYYRTDLPGACISIWITPPDFQLQLQHKQHREVSISAEPIPPPLWSDSLNTEAEIGHFYRPFVL
jgi:hypothetical protein